MADETVTSTSSQNASSQQPAQQPSQQPAQQPAQEPSKQPFIPDWFDPEKASQLDLSLYGFGSPVAEATGGMPIETRDVSKFETGIRQRTSKEYLDEEDDPLKLSKYGKKEPAKSFDEKVQEITETVERHPKHREIFLAVLRYCAEEHAQEDIEAFVAELPYYYNVRQTPYTLITNLQRAGGLDQIDYDADGNVVTEEQKQAVIDHITEEYKKTDQYKKALAEQQAKQRAEEIAAHLAVDPNLPEEEDFDIDENEEVALAEEAQTLEVSDVAFNDFETALEDAIEDAMDDLIDHSALKTSEAGAAVAEKFDPVKRIKDKVAEKPEREAVYRNILTFLRESHTLPQIQEFVKADPEFERANRGATAVQPSFYIDMLEASGGIVWTNATGWHITEEGEQYLSQLA